ncbi:hypothetical protein EDC04DRAFT_2635542, partial [Pisolithus marmoratus]
VFAVAAIVLCSLASVAACFAASISLATNPSLSKVLNLKIELLTWLERRKHLYPVLISTINRILRMTVQTGVLTTIVAIVDLTCYLTVSSGFHLIFSMALSKLYINCMLSTLNARGAWKYESYDNRSSENEASYGRNNHPRSVVFQPQSTQPEVFVEVESCQMTDTGDKPSHGIFGHRDTKRRWNDEESSTSASQV